MRRKTSQVPSRIWTYGCLPPTAGANLFQDQLERAHYYYNQLVEIERTRRGEYRAARAAHDSEIARLEAISTELTEQLTLAKQAKERDKPLCAQLRQQRKAVNVQLKEQRARARTDPVLQRASKEIDARAGAAIKALRAIAGLYWGTYLLVEKAMDAARKSKIDPTFKRWNATGRIGVQLQGGLDLPGDGSLVLDDTRLCIGPLAADTWTTPDGKRNRSGCRHAYTTVKLRVGSRGRDPVWVELPVLVHRRPPAGTIKEAWIKVSRCGQRTKHELQLCLESAAFDKPAPRHGVVAINFGWRAKDDGSMRVAYCVDDSGNERELSIPATLRSSLDHPSVLRSAGDLTFEAARGALRGWLADNAEIVSAEVREATAHIGQWRGHRKLTRVARMLLGEAFADDVEPVRLWQTWRDERLAAKANLIAPLSDVYLWLSRHGIVDELQCMAIYLDWWRRKDRHLYQWECDQRRKSIGHRQDIYRNWAAELCRKYRTVVMQEFDMRRVTRLPGEDESENEQTKLARANRVQAAPAELRSAILSAAAQGQVERVEATDNTRTCSACQHVYIWDAAASIMAQCPKCKHEEDQDARNCRNQLVRYRERPGDDGTPAGARLRKKRAGSAPPRRPEARAL